jgi:hypothetical protein
VAVSRRNIELLFLVIAGAVSTMAYVSVYAGRFREINRVSIIYGLVFVGIFFLLHLLVRFVLPQADPFLLPITALLAAIGLTEIFRIRPALALTQGQWLLVGAGLFVLTVLIVRDHMKLDRYRYIMGAIGLRCWWRPSCWAPRSTAPSCGSTPSASRSSRPSSPSWPS